MSPARNHSKENGCMLNGICVTCSIFLHIAHRCQTSADADTERNRDKGMHWNTWVSIAQSIDSHSMLLFIAENQWMRMYRAANNKYYVNQVHLPLLDCKRNTRCCCTFRYLYWVQLDEKNTQRNIKMKE